MTIKITSLSDPRLAPYASLTEAQLRNRLDPTMGLFIAESPKVIRVALDAGYIPLSLLCEERHITGDAAEIIARCKQTTDGGPGTTDDGQQTTDTFPVYTGEPKLLEALTGYRLTRGVLCAMRRPQPRRLEDVCRDAKRIVLINGVVDSTNVGAIFRSAAALGIDAVVLTRNSCDPLNRRAVRVSMGSVFLVPWLMWEAEESSLIDELRSMCFKTVAMALTDKSIPLDAPVLKTEPRLAIIMGTEGDGLPEESISSADYVVRIPMYHNVDSLNVAAASAVAFWELRDPSR